MIYFQATVHLKDQKQEQFFKAMAQLARLAPEQIHFRLVGAYIPMTGVQNTYINIWEAPDANAVANLGTELTRHPELQQVFRQVKECIAEETYQLMYPAPYAPQ